MSLVLPEFNSSFVLEFAGEIAHLKGVGNAFFLFLSFVKFIFLFLFLKYVDEFI